MCDHVTSCGSRRAPCALIDVRCHDEKVSEAESGAGARSPEPADRWAARATLAEQAVRARHLRPLWLMPGTLLGVCGWPASPAQRVFGSWNYWWQAHVLDCLVDAYVRAPDQRRRGRVARFVNGVRRRNGRGWLNDYYDDMAWLALALQRAEQCVGVRRPGAVGTLAEALRGGWSADGGGGIWWREKEKYDEDFKNVPTNGPAAILFARLRDRRAKDVARWIERHLVDPGTGVVWDGLHVSHNGGVREIETQRYTYCQGVYLGACVELAAWGDGGDGESAVWAERAVRTVEAVASHLTVLPTHEGSDTRSEAGTGAATGLVLRGQRGHDGGLFAGILARYLAQAALTLPEIGGVGSGSGAAQQSGPEYADAADRAAELVFASADAAWRHRAPGPGGPAFGPDWSRAAMPPRHRDVPERDLSVQVGAWMLLEAAALLARALPDGAGARAVGGRTAPHTAGPSGAARRANG